MKREFCLIDLDNTLLDFSLAEKNVFKKVVKLMGGEYSEENYSLYHSINDDLWKQHELGLVTREELMLKRFVDYGEAKNLKFDAVEINKFHLKSLESESHEIEGATELLKHLKEDGRKIYIVTNGATSVQKGRLKSQPMKEYFDGVFVSDQIGFQKPSMEYFDKVKELTGENFTYENSLILGDSLSSDIKGGMNLGIYTVWFNRYNRELKEGYRVDLEVHSLKELIGKI